MDTLKKWVMNLLLVVSVAVVLYAVILESALAIMKERALFSEAANQKIPLIVRTPIGHPATNFCYVSYRGRIFVARAIADEGIPYLSMVRQAADEVGTEIYISWTPDECIEKMGLGEISLYVDVEFHKVFFERLMELYLEGLEKNNQNENQNASRGNAAFFGLRPAFFSGCTGTIENGGGDCLLGELSRGV